MSDIFFLTIWFHTVELTSQMLNETWSGGSYYAVEQYLTRKQDEYLTQQLIEIMEMELRLNKAGVFN